MKHPVLGVFIIIFLFLSISVTLTGWQLKKTTSAKFIIKTLDQSGLYNNLPKLVDEAFSSSQNGSDAIAFKIISTAVEPTYLKTQVEKNLPNFMAYLNGKRATPDVEIDFRPIKAAVGSKSLAELEDIISQAMVALPTCTGSEDTSNGQIANCRPETMDAGTASASMAENLKNNPLLGASPDTYNLAQNIADPDTYFANAKASFKVLNITFLVSLIISIVLLTLLFLMGLNPWQAGLRWTGYALMLPGAFHLVVSLVGKASINPGLTACASKVNPTTAALLKPVIAVFANNIFNISMFYAGILFFLGLVMIILSYIFHAAIPEKEQNVQPVKLAK